MNKLFFAALALLSLSASAQSKKPMYSLLNHQAIYVVDLQRESDFYKDIVGLEPTAEPFKDGRHAWFKTGAHTMLHIIQGADSVRTYYKNHHICFSVPSLDGFIARLHANNIDYEDVNGRKDSVTDRVDGIKQIWLKDPEGYWLEINNDWPAVE